MFTRDYVGIRHRPAGMVVPVRPECSPRCCPPILARFPRSLRCGPRPAVVMRYVDNLLDWGDALFTEFTRESLNEATMLYVLAADVLGPRPPAMGACDDGQAAPDLRAHRAEPGRHLRLPHRAGAVNARCRRGQRPVPTPRWNPVR
jgi:hypothetical protein